MIDHGDHETLHVIKGGFFLFAVVRASKAPWLPSITRRATGGVPPCTVLARCAQPGPEDACFLLAISPTYQVRRRITTRLPMITCDFLLISKRKVKLVFLLCSCFTEPRWSTSVHTWNGEALPCQREPLTKVSIFTWVFWRHGKFFVYFNNRTLLYLCLHYWTVVGPAANVFDNLSACLQPNRSWEGSC